MHKFIVSFAVLAALTTGPALAQRAAKRVVVRHTDLDLNTASGKAKFDRRIAQATEQVCGSYARTSHEEEQAIDACRADVKRSVATQLAARPKQNVALR
jgi:UrcA family protein